MREISDQMSLKAEGGFVGVFFAGLPQILPRLEGIYNH